MNDKNEGTSNTKPLPPSEPSLFESIFGPLDEHEDVKCLENIIQELNDQPIQQLESTIDDQTQNEEVVASVLSKSGLYKKQCDKFNLTLYSRSPSK
jgi:hypothetical protein